MIEHQRQSQRQAYQEALRQAIEVPPRHRSRPPVKFAKQLATSPGLISGSKWLSRVITKDAMRQVTEPVLAEPSEEGFGMRPYYFQGKMEFRPDRQTASDLVHECIHHWDIFATQCRRAMMEYYERVTVGAAPRWLGMPYRENEYFKPRTDGKRWHHPYHGFLGGAGNGYHEGATLVRRSPSADRRRPRTRRAASGAFACGERLSFPLAGRRPGILSACGLRR